MASLKKEENAAQSFDNFDELEDKEKKAFFQKKNTKNKPEKHEWKKKAIERNEEIKKLKKRVEELTKSRNKWNSNP